MNLDIPPLDLSKAMNHDESLNYTEKDAELEDLIQNMDITFGDDDHQGEPMIPSSPIFLERHSSSSQATPKSHKVDLKKPYSTPNRRRQSEPISSLEDIKTPTSHHNSSRTSISSTSDLKVYRRSWRTPSASFVSSTPRFKETKTVSPASTSYYYPISPPQRNNLPDSSFSSSTPRWYQENSLHSTRTPTERQRISPSPCSYSPEKFIWDSRRGDLGSVSSFKTNSPRYFIQKSPVNSCSPPPTTYRPEDVNLDERKGNVSNSSFSSTTSRLFSDKLAHPTESPGPTAYQYEKVDMTSRNNNPAAASFKSASKRTFIEVAAETTEAPPSTLYSPSFSMIDPDVKTYSCMKSTSRRFFCDKTPETTNSPASTTYHPLVEGTFERLAAYPPAPVAHSTTDRFLYSTPKSTSPGPGAYYLPEVPESIDEAIFRRLQLKQRLEEAKGNQKATNDH